MEIDTASLQTEMNVSVFRIPYQDRQAQSLTLFPLQLLLFLDGLMGSWLQT